MSKANIRWAVIISLILVIGVFFFGCGCNDDDDDDNDEDGAPGNDDADMNDDVNDDAVNDDADDDIDDQPPEFNGLVSAVSGDQMVELSWDEAVDPSTPIAYNVYIAQTEGDQDFTTPIASTSTLSYDIPELENCAEYFFVVRAQDAADNEDDNTVEKSAIPITYNCGYTQFNRRVWRFVPPEGPYSVESVGWIEDQDGDGVPEALAHAYESTFTPDEADTTFCISGAPSRAGEMIWGVHPTNDNVDLPSDSGGYGDSILNTIDDLNGDDYQDVGFGLAGGAVGPGKASGGQGRGTEARGFQETAS